MKKRILSLVYLVSKNFTSDETYDTLGKNEVIIWQRERYG